MAMLNYDSWRQKKLETLCFKVQVVDNDNTLLLKGSAQSADDACDLVGRFERRMEEWLKDTYNEEVAEAQIMEHV